ncbi:hypothetical protein JCM10369A_08090 [Nocardioides pyridinolyticus]
MIAAEGVSEPVCAFAEHMRVDPQGCRGVRVPEAVCDCMRWRAVATGPGDGTFVGAGAHDLEGAASRAAPVE